MKAFTFFVLICISFAICEKVYQTLGFNSTQSPDKKYRAIVDKGSKEMKIMKMEDSTIVDKLNQCAISDESLPIWMNDSVMTFFDVKGDSVTLCTYDVKNKSLVTFGTQCQCNQTFSRTLVHLGNRNRFSLDTLKIIYPNNQVAKSGCK